MMFPALHKNSNQPSFAISRTFCRCALAMLIVCSLANSTWGQPEYANPSLQVKKSADERPEAMRIDLNDGLQPTGEFDPWWVNSIQDPIRNSGQQLHIDLDGLIIAALRSSPQIRIISAEPVIAESLTMEENARFDPVAFMETKWNDLNDPVGNRLTTGGPPFLEDHIWSAQAGVRKRTASGAQVELGQELGFQNSNSNFFLPQDQGTARLALNVTQPLLRGAGKSVNRSQIVVAQLNQNVVWDQYSRKLQEYLVSVIQGYWNLYYQRTVLLQRYRNYQRAVEIYKLLEGRAEFDAVVSQLSRARAAVLARKVEVRSLEAKLLNAETRLRELVRDERFGVLGDRDPVELLPGQLPSVMKTPDDISSLVSNAMEFRPEIDQVMHQIKSTSIELNVAKNDLLPLLGLVVEGYVAGLNGGSGVERAFQQQFGQVKPGYAIGFNSEYPFRNRAASARYARKQVQLRKLSDQMADAVGKVVADVEIANRELVTAYENFQNTIASVQSAVTDVKYIEERWKSFAFVENVDIATPNTLLEQLLDAQQRQSDAEVAFATAVRNYMNAAATLRLAEGTILVREQINTNVVDIDGLPQLDVSTERMPKQ